MNRIKTRLILGTALIIFAIAGFNIPHLLGPGDADLHLVLNIPAGRLDVFEHGERTHSYAVSAGRKEFATPPGTYHIRELIWNPWWHPPKSAWARNEKPYPPGPHNPMGRIKINFAPLYYIHGTPYEDDLGVAASHGCVRIGDDDLLELAHIIHRYRTPGVSEDLLSTLESNRTMTRSFHVRPIQFDVVYRLVEVVDGELIIHPDVYRNATGDLRDEILAALKDQGVTISPRIKAQLGAISKKRNATRLTIALDSLIAGTAGD